MAGRRGRAATGTAAGTAAPTRSRRPTTSATPSTRSATRCWPAAASARRCASCCAAARRDDAASTSCAARCASGCARPAPPGRMDGTLQEVRELLDKALTAERRELFPDPDDSARLAEDELDALPDDTAGAVRALKDYPWRSDEARQAYEQIQDLLRREVLDSSFASMKNALENATEADMQAVKDMVADLSAAHRRAQPRRGHRERFADFMDKHGQFFPDNPRVDRGAHRLPRPPGGRAGTDDGRPLPRAARRAVGPDGPDHGRHGPGQRDGPPAGRPAPGPPRPAVGAARAGARRRAGPRAWATPPPPSPSSPTSRRCPASCRRATRAPRWPTSTRSCSSGRWAGRPSTTSRRCARWSASWSGRATSTAPTAASSSPPRRSAGSGPRRCAGCSPSSTPPAGVTTTSPTPARPASSPAARGSGGSATSSRWTSSAR